MTKKSTHSVLSTGLQFLREALSLLKSRSEKQNRHGLLLLAASIELILKARLIKSDWRLVFSDPAQADRGKFDRGEFRSADFHEAVFRVRSLPGVVLPPNAEVAFRRIRSLRNALEHFGKFPYGRATRAALAAAVHGALDFVLAQEHQLGLTRTDRTVLARIRRLLPQFQELVDHRLAAIKSAVDAIEGMTLDCPECAQTAVFADLGTTCLFCGWKAEVPEAARRYVEAGVLESDEAFGNCPQCDGMSLFPLSGDLQDSVCLNCGVEYELGDLTECCRCGDAIASSEGLAICDACYSWRMEKD